MSTSAVTPAESAPAPAVEAVETPEVSVQERLDHATGPELDHWRKSGEIPAVKPPKPAESAAAKTSEAEPKLDASAASEKSGETAAASPAAPTQKKSESRSERRYREITKENQQLRERLEAIERRTAAPPATETRETPTSQPAEETKAETAAKPKPKIDDLDAAGKPKYTTIDQFIDARDEWTREQLLSEFEGRQSKAEQTRNQTEQERTLAEGLNRKFDAARKNHLILMRSSSRTKIC